MHRRMTITLDEAVYNGLIQVVGRRKISQFLEDLARPQVLKEDLAIAYQRMAEDQEREQEALDWSERLIADSSHATR